MEVIVKGYAIEVGILSVVRLLADRAGFDDVDVEPSPNNVKITASGRGNPYVATGRDLQAACESFLSGLDIASFGRRL